MCFVFAGSIDLSNQSVFVDVKKKIILINDDIDKFNSSFDKVSKLVIDNQEYVLSERVESFKVGQEYITEYEDTEYSLYFTSLPIVNMRVENPIVDTPKVLGNFTLITSDGKKVSSLIGVEYRGATSQAYPKKSMEIEFWKDSEGDDTVDYSLLGLRETDSYNLQAIYNEPLRVNSKLSNDFWRQMHTIHYLDKEPEAKNGITMEYVELFLNGEYRGVYALGEKVGRGQLKLKKYKDGEIKGELYKGDTWGGTTFTNLIPYDNSSDVWNGFEYKHPKEEIDWGNMYSLVDFVMNSSDEVFMNEYANYFEIDNIVDYFIFLNTLRATDNTGKNLYFAKYDEKGKYFFVPWDLDGTFGFIWDASKQDITNDLLFNGLYNRLWEDATFRLKLTKRWKELRKDVVTEENISSLFNHNINYLHSNKVYERESLVWEYNFEENNFEYVKDWLGRRLAYLDQEFGKALSVDDLGLRKEGLKIYPNPSSDYFAIKINYKGSSKVTVIDFSGKILLQRNDYKAGEVISIDTLNSGIYFVIVENSQSIQTSRLIVK